MLNLLLVEDDNVDAKCIQRSIRKLDFPVHLDWATDGLQALELLGKKRAEHFDYQLILLDLRMPRMDGFQFLDKLQQEPRITSAVIFVLSTSEHEPDLHACYSAGIAGYIPKGKLLEYPNALAELLSLYERIVVFPPSQSEYSKSEAPDRS